MRVSCCCWFGKLFFVFVLFCSMLLLGIFVCSVQRMLYFINKKVESKCNNNKKSNIPDIWTLNISFYLSIYISSFASDSISCFIIAEMFFLVDYYYDYCVHAMQCMSVHFFFIFFWLVSNCTVFIAIYWLYVYVIWFKQHISSCAKFIYVIWSYRCL